MADTGAHPTLEAKARPEKPAPLALPAIALLTGVAASDACGRADAGVVSGGPILCLCFFALAAAIPLAGRRWSLGALLLGALIAGFVRQQWSQRIPPEHVSNWVTQEGQLARVSGRIVTAATISTTPRRNPWLPMEQSPRTQFLLDLDELRPADSPMPARGLVRVTITGAAPDARFGARATLIGRIFRFSAARNPGEADWAAIFERQGISAGMSVESPELAKIETDPIRDASTTFIAALRRHTKGLLLDPGMSVDPDVTALLDAMVLGQRSAVAASLNDAFVRTGAIHLLSVSGFHVGLLGGAVWWIVRRIRRGRGSRLAAGITAVVLVLYALLAEPNAPIFRATIMGLLICAARLTGRSIAPLNWLALAALVLVLLDPRNLFQPGFQLSFVQVWFLIAAYTPLQRWITSHWFPALQRDVMTWHGLFARGIARALLGLLIVSIGCWLIAAPLGMLHFQRFAPWAGLDSLVLTPLAGVVTLLGFLTLVTQAIIPPLGSLLAHGLVLSSRALIGLATSLAHLPGTLIETSSPPPWLVLGTLGVAAIWVHLRVPPRPEWLERARSPRWRPWIQPTLVAAAVLAWVLWIALPAHSPPRVPTLHVLSVGNGSAALLVLPDGTGAAFDIGTNRNLDAGEIVGAAARAIGLRRLEWMTLSHADFDHFSGALTALDLVPTATVALTPQFARELRTDASLVPLHDGFALLRREPRVLRTGDAFSVGGAQIDALWPPDDPDMKASDNDTSLVLRLRVGSCAVLIPGDIEQQAMIGLLAEQDAGRLDLHADVLIAPHHGSVRPKATERFLSAVRPAWIIVSTAQPRPALATLAKRAAPEARVIETGSAGAVSVELGETLRVQSIHASSRPAEAETH